MPNFCPKHGEEIPLVCGLCVQERLAKTTQPPPLATGRRPAWDIVIEFAQNRRGDSAYANDGTLDMVLADMRERDRIGRERYGVPLTSHNGRKHLIDAYQEALDLAVYLAAELDEHDVGPETIALSGKETHWWYLRCLQQTFWEHMRTVMRLRAFIKDGAGGGDSGDRTRL